MSEEEEEFDDFEVVHLDEEEVQRVLDWSILAGTVAIMMTATAPPDDEAELKSALDNILGASKILCEQMPESIMGIAHATAQRNLDEAEREIEEVEKFREELDGL